MYRSVLVDAGERQSADYVNLQAHIDNKHTGKIRILQLIRRYANKTVFDCINFWRFAEFLFANLERAFDINQFSHPTYTFPTSFIFHFRRKILLSYETL